MTGRRTSQSIISHKDSQLTVRPLNAWNLSKFKPCKIQEGSVKETQDIFRDGLPPHQAMFYDGKKSILACGFISIGDGQFYAWTIFGKDFKRFHYKFFARYVNNYLDMLEYTSIHHLIYKDREWTKKMMKIVGFSYVRDEDDKLEHWIKVN